MKTISSYERKRYTVVIGHFRLVQSARNLLGKDARREKYGEQRGDLNGCKMRTRNSKIIDSTRFEQLLQIRSDIFRTISLF